MVDTDCLRISEIGAVNRLRHRRNQSAQGWVSSGGAGFLPPVFTLLKQTDLSLLKRAGKCHRILNCKIPFITHAPLPSLTLPGRRHDGVSYAMPGLNNTISGIIPYKGALMGENRMLNLPCAVLACRHRAGRLCRQPPPAAPTASNAGAAEDDDDW